MCTALCISHHPWQCTVDASRIREGEKIVITLIVIWYWALHHCGWRGSCCERFYVWSLLMGEGYLIAWWSFVLLLVVLASFYEIATKTSCEDNFWDHACHHEVSQDKIPMATFHVKLLMKLINTLHCETSYKFTMFCWWQKMHCSRLQTNPD